MKFLHENIYVYLQSRKMILQHPNSCCSILKTNNNYLCNEKRVILFSYVWAYRENHKAIDL